MRLAAALILATLACAAILALAGCAPARVIGNAIVNPANAN